MKQKLFMLVWDMDVNKGGINRVMLNRSSLLSEYYDVTLLTLDFKVNYDNIQEDLLKIGRLNNNVNILNIHDYYRDKYDNGKLTGSQVNYYKEQVVLKEAGYQVQDDEVKTKNYARYFKNGTYTKYKKWNKDGMLLHIDHFNEQRNRLSREHFLPDGFLYRKTFFDLQLNKPVQDLFFTKEGKCFLSKWYNPKEGNVIKVFLINPKDNSVKMFSNNREFNTFWLTELSLKVHQKPIVICDGPGSTSVMLNVSSDLIYKISAIHSNHFSSPYKYGSPIKKNHLTILENINNFDALVVLTESQKEHILKQYGQHDNIHVIPHFIEPLTKDIVNKDPKLITMVARYHAEKNIDLAILAFRKVVDKVPDAKLEIYGDGPDVNRLKSLIEEHNLKNNVFLKGYLNKVENAFSKSLASLLTSKYEGFSLVILESMACSTPVISFDMLYGPKDIIINEVNGILIPNSDTDLLAEKVIWLLENPTVAKDMGLNGKKYVLEKYAVKKHKKDWLNLLTPLKSKKKWIDRLNPLK